ncbi:hypothetical protein [Neosynechococcus sphagnicola]|uniref:hypothetical protein n=1 Tax=Neosynechococcus sphagnicola TaxID=1501145 RepID=UPI0030843923
MPNSSAIYLIRNLALSSLMPVLLRGGKTTHLAELMADQGTVWACDRNPARLKKPRREPPTPGVTIDSHLYRR